MLLIPRNARLSSLLSTSSLVVPAQMMCGMTVMSYLSMIAAHTVVSLMRLRTRCLLKLPSLSSRYSYSSLWLVTLMYFGLNSMNGAMLSRSSSFVMPLRGGTISSDGKAFVLPASISVTFIVYFNRCPKKRLALSSSMPRTDAYPSYCSLLILRISLYFASGCMNMNPQMLDSGIMA